MKHHVRAAGFTLIELLVAVSLLALVSVLGYRGLDSMLRARDGLDKRSQELALLNETWRWLGRDLKNLVPTQPSTAGAKKIQTSIDDSGNAVLNLYVFSEARDLTGTEKYQYQLVTYRIAGGSLQRIERSLQRGSDKPELTPMELTQASSWKLSYKIPSGTWNHLPNGSAPETLNAIQVSLTLLDQTFIRVFTLSL